MRRHKDKPTLRDVRAFSAAVAAVRAHPAAPALLRQHADTFAAMFQDVGSDAADRVAIRDATEFLTGELSQLNRTAVAQIAQDEQPSFL